MSNKEREAEEDTKIVDHLWYVSSVWSRLLKCGKRPSEIGQRFPSPDPCLHNVALASELHTFDFWLN